MRTVLDVSDTALSLNKIKLKNNAETTSNIGLPTNTLFVCSSLELLALNFVHLSDLDILLQLVR